MLTLAGRRSKAREEREGEDARSGNDHRKDDQRLPLQWTAFQPHRECASWLSKTEGTGLNGNGRVDGAKAGETAD
jgi:hypothetical protein